MGELETFLILKHGKGSWLRGHTSIYLYCLFCVAQIPSEGLPGVRRVQENGWIWSRWQVILLIVSLVVAVLLWRKMSILYCWVFSPSLVFLLHFFISLLQWDCIFLQVIQVLVGTKFQNSFPKSFGEYPFASGSYLFIHQHQFTKKFHPIPHPFRPFP